MRGSKKPAACAHTPQGGSGWEEKSLALPRNKIQSLRYDNGVMAIRICVTNEGCSWKMQESDAQCGDWLDREELPFFRVLLTAQIRQWVPKMHEVKLARSRMARKPNTAEFKSCRRGKQQYGGRRAGRSPRSMTAWFKWDMHASNRDPAPLQLKEPQKSIGICTLKPMPWQTLLDFWEFLVCPHVLRRSKVEIRCH